MKKSPTKLKKMSNKKQRTITIHEVADTLTFILTPIQPLATYES